MFTGIIENTSIVKDIQYDKTNMILTLETPIAHQFHIDQSIAHNGVCLTVTKVEAPLYQVTLIQETNDRTNFKYVKINDVINIERSMMANSRLDGHFVTGHVDCIGRIEQVNDKDGSVEIVVSHSENPYFITIPKGSITVNGISLTVVNSEPSCFSVHIIPYTLHHTNIQYLKAGDSVNLEFDIIGKYIYKILSQMNIKK